MSNLNALKKRVIFFFFFFSFLFFFREKKNPGSEAKILGVNLWRTHFTLGDLIHPQNLILNFPGSYMTLQLFVRKTVDCRQWVENLKNGDVQVKLIK